MSQTERNEATPNSDLNLPTTTYPPVGIHEAHTMIVCNNNQRSGDAPVTRTRQRKMGVTSAPEIPLEIPPKPEPPAPVLTNWMPNIQQPNIRQSSLRVGEDVVCHRFCHLFVSFSNIYHLLIESMKKKLRSIIPFSNRFFKFGIIIIIIIK